MGLLQRIAMLAVLMFATSACTALVNSDGSSVSVRIISSATTLNEPLQATPSEVVPTVVEPSDSDVVEPEQEGTLSCAPKTVSGRVNKWVRPGANAYTGTLALALHFFKGVPSSVKTEWLRLEKEGNPKRINLKPGDRFCEMVYSAKGYHHVWQNVEVSGDWTTSGDTPSGADVYSVTEGGLIYELIRPDVCANWAYRILREASTESAVPVSTSAVAEVESVSDSYTLRARFWKWESIPSDLQKKILEVNAREGDITYPFEMGAVSRDLGSMLFQSWMDGEAMTIERCITADVELPDSSSSRVPIKACPGDHPEYPDLVYWETNLSRVEVSSPEAQFGVIPEAPDGCAIVYPRENQQGERLLDTRPGELRESELAGDSGMNLNAIVSCPTGT